MKKLAWVLLACIASPAMAQNVVPGPAINPACVPQSLANCTQWTPAQWTTAWQSVVSANGGYLTNGQLFGTTVNNGTISGGTISGVSIPSYQPVIGYTPYNATNPAGYQTAAQVASIYAPLISPTFTGSPTVPGYLTTAAAGTTYAPLSSPTLTGIPAAPTGSAGTNTTQIATTAFDTAAVGVETARATAAEALKAPLASPTFTGTPNVTVNLSGSTYASGLTVMGTALGSGTNGPVTAQNGVSINLQSIGYPATGARAGEIDGLSIFTRQANPASDSSGILINSQCTGLGFCSATEFVSSILTGGTIGQMIDVQEGALDVAGNYYIGAVYTANIGTLGNALQVQANAGAAWTNALVVSNSAGTVKFTLDAAGNIVSSGSAAFASTVTAPTYTLNSASGVNAFVNFENAGTTYWQQTMGSAFGNVWYLWDQVGARSVFSAAPNGAIVVGASNGGAAASTAGATTTIFAQNGGSGNTAGGNIILSPGAASGSGTVGQVVVNGVMQVNGWIDGTIGIYTPSATLNSDAANGNLELGNIGSSTANPYIDFNGFGVNSNVRIINSATGGISFQNSVNSNVTNILDTGIYSTGNLTILGGTAGSGVAGANAAITAQAGGAGNTAGGNIVLTPGAPSGSGAAGIVQAAGPLTAPSITLTPYTSSSIGGSALLAGACASTTVSITGLTTAMVVDATPATYPGDSAYWKAYASAAGTATVKVCEAIAGTPTASIYNLRVIQ